MVNVNNRNDPFSRVKRWFVGPYDHVFMYIGKVGVLVTRRQPRILRFSMLFESNGRGVVVQSLSNRYGQEVAVMRLKPEYRKRIPAILGEAIKLASEDNAYYDYLCIAQFVLPRLICKKLHLPLPLKYQRNPLMICSEALLEVFLRAKVLILPEKVVPLPGDFIESGIVDEAQRGRLSPEWVLSPQ